ncbi:hypothetical protein yc1106_06901 [Curvularia clavata]|uniref:Uncharacterized protein n=1 Tax=Curvularia clavata TaxID=95742 RepID=A0A9Q9DUA7_CURCL|nr:hypothetical protein yc1106_06901 [Curvularia clavata]
MSTPYRPSSRLSTNSRFPSSILAQLLDEINGRTETPAASCNSEPSRTCKRYTDWTMLLPRQANVNRVRLDQGTEKRTPSVRVGGSAVAQNTGERLRAVGKAHSKKTNILPEHHGLGEEALPRPRPNLGRLTTQFPAPSHEVAQSSSEPTSSESGLSSTASYDEAPSSALTASSTNATVALSHIGSGNNIPHKRERDIDDTECQHVSKKMRLMPSSDVQDSATAKGKPKITTDPQGLVNSGNVVWGKAFPDRTMAPTSTGPPSSGHGVATDDLVSAKVLRPAMPQRESGWQRTCTTPDRPETPETPSWARSFHLVDTSGFTSEGDISIYKSLPMSQGEEDPLCEYCFRRHGLFSRVLEHGCETCGREKCLREYYWGPAVGSNY